MRVKYTLLISGEKLLPGDKYAMSEVPINQYAYQLNMTIRRLDKNDFGSYTCSSENGFGKAEGSVRLQGELSKSSTCVIWYWHEFVLLSELHLSKTTLPSVRHNEVNNISRNKISKGRRKHPQRTESDDREDSSALVRSEENYSPTTPFAKQLGREGVATGILRPPVGPPQAPAPAPAPAHSPPTELVVLNHGSTSHRRCQFGTLTITVIVLALISPTC